MNILVLTPDSVGSTLLQRLITIYCQFQNFSKPYINIHEITNGLAKFYSQDFNLEILHRDQKLQYSQSLPEIIKLLEGVDHNIVARLAQYHLNRRQDSSTDLGNLYNFCNDNFFIIATRRKNVFDYALSQYINRVTNILNVYSPGEKIDIFAKFYQSPIAVDQLAFVQILEQYKKYVEWSEKFFNIGSYYDYSTDVSNIERYILNLPLFDNKNKLSWHDTFDISFKDWNLCHLLTSDLDNIPDVNALTSDQTSATNPILNVFYKDTILTEYNNVADPSWPNVKTIDDYRTLPSVIADECQQYHKLTGLDRFFKNQDLINQLPRAEIQFLSDHQQPYINGLQTIKQMMDLGILPGSVPIKKQTLEGKSKIIKNFSECLETYNNWAIKSGVSDTIDIDTIHHLMSEENTSWRSSLTEDQLLQHLIDNKL